MQTRRSFNAGLASAAFGGLALAGCSRIKNLPDYVSRIPDFGDRLMMTSPGYGKLVLDTSRTLSSFEDGYRLDLPPDFSYEIISHYKETMTDKYSVPDKADGMGCFKLDSDRLILVRNHELGAKDAKRGAFRNHSQEACKPFMQAGDSHCFPGGTTTITYNPAAGKVESQFLSLTGTIRNCAGGATPWGTWLSCEEDLTDGHGYVHEVPALHDGLAAPKPLEHLGRFKHEAAAVDPLTNIIYMTEDQVDSLFYRYVPAHCDRPLDEGGSLQALAFDDIRYGTDSRNWGRDRWAIGEWRKVRWVPLDEKNVGTNDPRKKAVSELNVVRFGCGEGIHFGNGELYFTCTSGGRIKSGQIMRYRPDPGSSELGWLQLFVESTDPRTINYADNLTVAPNGDLIVCEDPYFGGERNYGFRDWPIQVAGPAPCYLRGVTPGGEVYNLARLEGGSELAGVCFSPEGDIMFVNVYSPSATLAVRGPWKPSRLEWGVYDAGKRAGTASCGAKAPTP